MTYICEDTKYDSVYKLSGVRELFSISKTKIANTYCWRFLNADVSILDISKQSYQLTILKNHLFPNLENETHKILWDTNGLPNPR